jgi:predicted DNA-binding antitoxin AbrB/MazE fold protein
MKTVTAIYEDGVFRPTQPVDLPEHCKVEIDVHVPLEKGEDQNDPSSAVTRA